MLIRILGLTLALFSASAIVNAEEAHYYLGVDYGDFNYKVDSTGYSPDNADGFILRLGYDFNNWFAVEGHVADVDDFEDNGSVVLTSSTAFGVYGRANLRFKQTTLYALAGASRVKFNNAAETGLAYGVGLDIYGSKNTAFTLGFTRYFDDKAPSGADIIVSAATFGITHYFGNVPKIHKRY